MQILLYLSFCSCLIPGLYQKGMIIFKNFQNLIVNFLEKRLDNANHYTPFTGTHKMEKITTQAEMIEWLREHRKLH